MGKPFLFLLVLSFFSMSVLISCKKSKSPVLIVVSPKDSSMVKTDTSNKSVLKAITIIRTGLTYPTLKAAVDAASAQDLIKVPAGTYTNDFVEFTKPLTIKGSGGMAHFVASLPPPNKKAIFLVNCDITFDHIEMSGCAIAASDGNNGAGIKQETGKLTLTYCYFHDNQNGVLTNAPTTGILVNYCEFAHNGAGDGYSHNIYIGATQKATITNSYFHDAVVGHEIKCRALNSDIENCRIQNGSGSASYCIDIPQGGVSIIKNDTIEKGINAQNPSIIHFGGEAVNAGSSLQVSSNLVVSLKTGYTFVRNQMADASLATLTGNSVFGLDDASMLNGNGTVSGTVHLSTQPTLNRSSQFHQ